jgi:uncharacterized repeat protein (TIGR04138 family)
MANEPSPQSVLQEICRRDPRYPLEAYEFLFAALGYLQNKLKNQPAGQAEGPHHVTGRQLAEGCRDLALQEFGLMARTVFQRWGINATADFGEMVYHLIDVQLLSKTETDRKEDFHNVYDLDKDLRAGYRIALEGS